MADHYHLETANGRIIKHDHFSGRKPHEHAGFIQHSNTLSGIERKQKVYKEKLRKHYSKGKVEEDILMDFKTFVTINKE